MAPTTTDTDPHAIWPEFMAKLPQGMGVTVIRNKADLSGDAVGMDENQQYPVISLSAKNAQGIELVRDHLKACIGFHGRNRRWIYGASPPFRCT
ncbi:hypothetical protein P4S68_01230 [Pseudoalteromonas sp. Hal099]